MMGHRKDLTVDETNLILKELGKSMSGDDVDRTLGHHQESAEVIF